jgi:hypothetical protein
VALRAVERLAERGTIPARIAADAKSSVWGVPARIAEPGDAALPLPHPLDYEWRFTAETAASLLQRALVLSKPGDILALLGVTTVFRAAAAHRDLERRVVLVDCNRPMLECLRSSASLAEVVHGDILRARLPAEKATVVVSDGPWYPRYLEAFLAAASRLCMPLGQVLVSVPPEGTRPGMEEEWRDLRLEASGLGLRLAGLEPLTLSYVSPLFERNALRAEGITNYPYNWRRGNLAIFMSEDRDSSARPSALPFEDPWSEEVIRGVRIRVRPGDDAAVTDPTLLPLVAGDVLPSVSARDERRRRVEVWTSGNRVFGCRGKRVLRALLRALSRGREVSSEVELELGRALSPQEGERMASAEEQVLTLVEVEREEVRLYVS